MRLPDPPLQGHGGVFRPADVMQDMFSAPENGNEQRIFSSKFPRQVHVNESLPF